jgi:formamidopyrimidine-DNA glycosylase
VAGLGNIYVCEALFRSGIAPTKEACRVSERAAERLAIAVRDVLNEAILVGGSSLRDYRQADGSSGAFHERFRVYDRESAPCVACGKPIQRIVQGGRSTFFCRKCQR